MQLYQRVLNIWLTEILNLVSKLKLKSTSLNTCVLYVSHWMPFNFLLNIVCDAFTSLLTINML